MSYYEGYALVEAVQSLRYLTPGIALGKVCALSLSCTAPLSVCPSLCSSCLVIRALIHVSVIAQEAAELARLAMEKLELALTANRDDFSLLTACGQLHELVRMVVSV